MKRDKGVIFVFIAPALVIFLLVFIYPIVRTLFMSFYKVESVTAPVAQWTWSGFDNYVKLYRTELFRTSMWNLFRIWIVGGALVMSVALLFAVILNSGIRFKRFFRAVIYVPNIVSAVALATMWLQYVYHPRFGLLKTFFTWLGLEQIANTPWTGTEYMFWSLLFAYCFGMVGYHMLIFSSGIEKIPVDYFDASTIDGAGKPRQFRHITWPLLSGVLKTNVTMWSITSVGFFIWSQLFSTVTASNQTITPMVYMYLQTFGAGNVVTERNAGLGAAVGVIMALCVVAAFLLTNLLIKKDDFEY